MAHVWSSKTLDAAELADLYEWLDSLPLGIVRSQVEKDFADGCLAAEVVRLYFPDIVNMKHFTPAQNVQDRIAQWKLVSCSFIYFFFFFSYLFFGVYLD